MSSPIVPKADAGAQSVSESPPVSNKKDSERETKLLDTQIIGLSRSIEFSLGHTIRWYLFFVTFSFTVMGVLFLRDKEKANHTLEIIVAGFCMLHAFGAFHQLWFVKRETRIDLDDLEKMRRTAWGVAPGENLPKTYSGCGYRCIVPFKFIRYHFIVGLIVTFTIILLWAYLIWQSAKAINQS